MSSVSRSAVSTKTITSVAMLTGVAYIVMLCSKMLPSVNGFLDFDFKDVVICIGGFTYGPTVAALISVLVAFIEFITVSGTGPIGFLMNALATCSFCCTASLVYKKRHTKAGAIWGLALGVVCLVAVMLLWNYLITPIYQGVPREVVAGMLPTVFLPFNLVKGGLNMAVTLLLWNYLITPIYQNVPRDVVAAMLPTVFFPFNLAKGGMNMAATLLLYKPIVTALRKAGLAPPSTGSKSGGKRFSAGFVLFSLALLGTFVTLALVLYGVI